MRRFLKIISFILTCSAIIVLSGCKKTIRKIDPSKVVSALEEVYGIEETGDNGIGSDFYEYDEHIGYYDCRILAYVDKSTSDSIEVTYKTYNEKDDATNDFASLYTQYTKNNNENITGYYTEGKNGYFIYDTGDYFVASYFVDNMIISVSAHTEENVELTRMFLETLGLPTE